MLQQHNNNTDGFTLVSELAQLTNNSRLTSQAMITDYCSVYTVYEVAFIYKLLVCITHGCHCLLFGGADGGCASGWT